MKLFFAGNVATRGAEGVFIREGLVWRLLTYAHLDSWAKEAFSYWTSTEAPAPFFLDSGAYSAYTQGVMLDLDHYCDYIAQHKHYFSPYASLDVIGDWKSSGRNYDIMRNRGLNPVPTFHANSPVHELKRLLEETDYIALGGLVGLGSWKVVRPWLDKCWRTIRDYWPKKVHVFGVTAQWCLERYPWFSADSSSAIVSATLGSLSRWEQGRIRVKHYTDHCQETLDGTTLDHVARMRAKNGSAHMPRRIHNIRTQLELQQHVTDLWCARGIDWGVLQCSSQ